MTLTPGDYYQSSNSMTLYRRYDRTTLYNPVVVPREEPVIVVAIVRGTTINSEWLVNVGLVITPDEIAFRIM